MIDLHYTDDLFLPVMSCVQSVVWNCLVSCLVLDAIDHTCFVHFTLTTLFPSLPPLSHVSFCLDLCSPLHFAFLISLLVPYPCLSHSSPCASALPCCSFNLIIGLSVVVFALIVIVMVIVCISVCCCCC